MRGQASPRELPVTRTNAENTAVYTRLTPIVRGQLRMMSV
jgi:hypothetical protein